MKNNYYYISSNLTLTNEKNIGFSVENKVPKCIPIFMLEQLDVAKYIYVEFSLDAKSLSLINVPLITHAVQYMSRAFWEYSNFQVQYCSRKRTGRNYDGISNRIFLSI